MLTMLRSLPRPMAGAWTALTIVVLLGVLTGWAMRGWLAPPAAVVRIEMHVIPVLVPSYGEETEL